MIEAELKARVHHVNRVLGLLRGRASAEETATYHDVYYDTPAGGLERDGRELRVRVVETAAGARCLLTYKQPAVDAASGSKPEHEITTVDAGAAATLEVILRALGVAPVLAFTKQCRNFRITSGGREMLATVATVPEIAGTWLEVETLAEPDELTEALDAVRAALAELDIAEADLTGALYTDAVRATRNNA
ncbi:CYTH domain-containing protein [Solihabitans fulvus]|uniref:CYTH domain-containing protein n=1 Tax=Solihabitans fulvus TaxID=1892852 RepID=A0A5B2W8A0_9PSEU|nr:CYTH domain-containing protein [Solihabitans fulvus]